MPQPATNNVPRKIPNFLDLEYNTQTLNRRVTKTTHNQYILFVHGSRHTLDSGVVNLENLISFPLKWK